MRAGFGLSALDPMDFLILALWSVSFGIISVRGYCSARAEQAVFIDDNEAYVKAGKRAGIRWSLRFRSVSVLKREIAEILREDWPVIQKS